MGPPHLANRCYRLLGLRIALPAVLPPTRNTLPLGSYLSYLELPSSVSWPTSLKQYPLWQTFTPLWPSLYRHAYEASPQNTGHRRSERRLCVERPPKRPFYMQSVLLCP